MSSHVDQDAVERKRNDQEMRCFRRLLGISYRDYVKNEKVRNTIRHAIGPYEDLISPHCEKTPKARRDSNHGHRVYKTYANKVEGIKEFGGRHECEVYGTWPGNMESDKTWAACKKYPGHEEFIPYAEFRQELLPESARTPEMLARVRNLAASTVRIRVGYTSDERPKGYPFHSVRGSCLVHTGSGWVEDVHQQPSVTCPCLECASRPLPHLQSYEIMVRTAAHVVYNSEEAKATQVDFFYDDERSMLEGRTKTIWGLDVVDNDANRDMCCLRCVTHDDELAKQLLSIPEVAMPLEFPNARSTPRLYTDCAIVSHPHGQPKKITFGKMVSIDIDQVASKVTYTTHTCPGSSGSPVMGLCDLEREPKTCSIVHSLGQVSGGGLNEGSSLYLCSFYFINQK